MLNSANIMRYMKQLGYDVTENEIKKLLKKEEREKIAEIQRARFSYEIWDKKSPINNVPAKDIIESRNYDIGQAYLIYIDGKIIYFQDHNPNKNGYIKMTKKEAIEIAESLIDKKIEESVDRIILENIKKELVKNG